MPLMVTLGLSIVFLLGIALGGLVKDNDKVEEISVALSFGAMLAVVAFDIIPEMVQGIGEGSVTWWKAILFTLTGFIVLFLLDRLVPEHEGKETSHEGNLVHIGIMATLAIAIHNTVEGMSVYSLASISLTSGILLALGVALHNIPMGMLIYSTTRTESRGKKAVIFSVSSLSTFLGGILMMLLETYISVTLVGVLTPIALGMVLYILFWELLGDIVRGKNRLWSLLWIMVGLALVMLGGIFE